MKNDTIPFPREFKPGSTQLADIRAVKRALAKEHGATGGMSLKTNTFSLPAQEMLIDFKQRHKLLADPIYTVQAHDKLTPFFDEYGASIMNRVYTSLRAAAARNDYVAEWRWCITNHSRFNYAQVRPIPVGLPEHAAGPINTDCSGCATLCAKWAGLSDPNGFGFNGAGNTGTILAHCKHITVAQALPGDLIVYRAGAWDMYGHHVVAIMSRISPTDFNCGSHGHQGSPESVTHSAELQAQASMGYPYFTVCRWLAA